MVDHTPAPDLAPPPVPFELTPDARRRMLDALLVLAAAGRRAMATPPPADTTSEEAGDAADMASV